MKNKVIEFFQNLPENKAEQFNNAFEFYRQSPGKSEATERVLNASGYSDSNLNNLLYDLQKMHGITDVEKLPVVKHVEAPDFRIEILHRVIKLTQLEFVPFLNEVAEKDMKLQDLIDFAIETRNDLAILALIEIESFDFKYKAMEYFAETPLDEIIAGFGVLPNPEDFKINLEFAELMKNEKAIEKVNQILELAKKPAQDLTIVKDDTLILENQDLKNEKEDLIIENQDLQDEKEELKDENEVLKLKLALKDALPKISTESLRVEYPFLNDKNCPDELKILVADKITLWNEYLTLHDEALKAESGELKISKEDLEIKAKRAVECFTENQKIHDELNAYKETGKVLGSHPLFRTLQIKREVEAMTMDEKIKYKNSSSKFFTDNKKNLAAAEKEDNQERIEILLGRIDERTLKLKLVNDSLGVK